MDDALYNKARPILVEDAMHEARYAKDNTPTVLFLPPICSPPIGLYWPTDVGYTTFLKSVQSLLKAYDPFILLLKQEKFIFDKWFKAVKKNPADHLADIGDTATLLTELPSTLRPDAPKVIDNNTTDALVQMVNEWAWMLYTEYRSTTTAAPQIHQAWQSYLD